MSKKVVIHMASPQSSHKGLCQGARWLPLRVLTTNPNNVTCAKCKQMLKRRRNAN